jgi:hypothetical protein
MALLSSRGISTPSLQAQGEQRRSSYFNIHLDIAGTWPAFWFAESVPKGSPPTIGVEADMTEFYGQFPDIFHSGYIIWDGIHHTHTGDHYVEKVPAGTLDADFHTFGMEVEPDFMTITTASRSGKCRPPRSTKTLSWS